MCGTCSASLVSAADVDQLVAASGSMNPINELDSGLLLRRAPHMGPLLTVFVFNYGVCA